MLIRYRDASGVHSASLDQADSTFRSCDPFKAEPVVPGIQHPAGDIRCLNAFIHKGVREQLREKLRVVGWAIKDEVTNSPYFVSTTDELREERMR